MSGELFPITISDQIAEVKREIALRETVYPRWVQQWKLSEAQAARQIAVMRSILADLEEQKNAGQ
jgi:hypothetical protein